MLGGDGLPRPAEITLPHTGVRFLDELPEFRRIVLESLRQPLEDREVTIVRARTAVRFPASFALVAAMNPCPCGYANSLVRQCTCSLGAIRRYRGRLSGPLLDRFDLQVWVPPTPFAQLSATRDGEPSSTVQARVIAARERQRQRLPGTRLHANPHPRPPDLHRWGSPDDASATARLQLAAKRVPNARARQRPPP